MGWYVEQRTSPPRYTGFKAKYSLFQATGLSFKSLNETSSPAKSKDIRVRLSPENKLFRLEDDHDVELGEVEARTGEILRALSIPKISLQLFTTPRRSQKEWVRTQVKRKTRVETFVSLSLIIYGSMELCEPVGDFASECNIVLQDPTKPVRNVMYKNPHLLMEPDEKLVSTLALSDAGVVHEIETVVSKDGLKSLAAADLFPENVIFDETEAPWQIRTSLLR